MFNSTWIKHWFSFSVDQNHLLFCIQDVWREDDNGDRAGGRLHGSTFLPAEWAGQRGGEDVSSAPSRHSFLFRKLAQHRHSGHSGQNGLSSCCHRPARWESWEKNVITLESLKNKGGLSERTVLCVWELDYLQKWRGGLYESTTSCGRDDNFWSSDFIFGKAGLLKVPCHTYFMIFIFHPAVGSFTHLIMK